MCKSFFTIVLLCFVTISSRAQVAHEHVRTVVEPFFDGMRQADSTAVRAVLHPDARFLTTLMRGDEPVLHVGSIPQFLEAVGTPRDEVWDERIWNLDVKVDDRLASVWMEYAFYLGEQLSHCGANAFQLFHGAHGWKVIQITDTRRRDGCDIPDGG